MASWLDGITYTVEVAFASTPLAVSPTWTDVSAYVRAIPLVSRGRRSEYDDFGPGTLQVVFDNRDRRFDPDHASGPYFGNLLPMKRIRVTVGVPAVGFSALLFTGFVLGWPQEDDNVDLTSTVVAVDGSRFAQNAPLAGSAYEAAVLASDPLHYYPMQEVVDGLVLDEVGSTHLRQASATAALVAITDESYPVGARSGITNLDPSRTYATAFNNDANSVTALPAALEFWARPGVDTQIVAWWQSNDFWQVFIRDQHIAVDYYNATADRRHQSFIGGTDFNPVAELPDEITPHHVAVWADTSNLYILVDGRLWTSALATVVMTGSPDAPFISTHVTSDSSVSHLAIYATAPSQATFVDHYVAGVCAWGRPVDEFGGARIGRVLDEIGWPAALRQIDAGSTPQYAYLPDELPWLDYVRAVERSEQGLVFFDVQGRLRFIDRESLWQSASAETFSDDGAVGAVRYVTYRPEGNHVDTVRNIVTTSYASTGAITRRDAASIAAYGEAREFVDAPTMQTASGASNLSAYVLREQATPRTRITELRVAWRTRAGSITTQLPKVLAREIGDVITVERTPRGVGAQVVKRVIVQGVEHQVGPSQGYTSLYLSPAPTSSAPAPYLTVGDATLGKVGSTAGNRVPF